MALLERSASLGQCMVHRILAVAMMLNLRDFVSSLFPDFEKRVIQAVAQIQQEVNPPISFHPGRHPESPFEIMRVFAEAGGKCEDVIMSHLDSNIKL